MRKLLIALLLLPVVLVSPQVRAQLTAVTNSIQDLLTSTVKSVKTVPGTLSWYSCWNNNGAVTYVQVFDVKTAVLTTPGTTQPKLSLALATTQVTAAQLGVPFFNGIQVAATTTPRGATGPNNTIACNFGFQ